MRKFSLLIALISLILPTKSFPLYHLLGTSPLSSTLIGKPEGLWTTSSLKGFSLTMAFANREWHITSSEGSDKHHGYSVERLFSVRVEKPPFFIGFGAELNGDPYNRYEGYEIEPDGSIVSTGYYRMRDRSYLLAIGGSIKFGEIKLGGRVKGIKNTPPLKISMTTWEVKDDSIVAVTKSGKESAASLDLGFSYKKGKSTFFFEAENILKSRLDYYVFHNAFGRTTPQVVTGLPLNLRIGGFLTGNHGDWYRLTLFYLWPQEIRGKVFRSKYVFGPGGSLSFGLPLIKKIRFFASFSVERYSVGKIEDEYRFSLLGGVKIPTFAGYTHIFMGWDDAKSGVKGASVPITIGISNSF